MESAERVEDLLVQGQSSVKQKFYPVKGRIPRLEAWGEVKKSSKEGCPPSRGKPGVSPGPGSLSEQKDVQSGAHVPS